MMPKYHIIYGGLFSLILYLVFPSIGLLGFGLIWFSSFFVDLDHFLRYVWKKKSINPFRCLKWSVKERRKWLALKNRSPYKNPFFIFHGIEFLILLVILSFFWKPIIYIIIGISFHLCIDYIELFFNHCNLLAKFSQIWVLITNRNKKLFN
jgi:hypothetical protein